LPEFSARNPADTVIILERGKTVVLKGVNFESGKATLTNNSEGALRSALNALFASETVNVLIVGHTDNVGKAAYNKKLSLRRAQTVKSWLIKRKISARRLTVAGKGSAEPIDDNSMPEGRANNRRIEFRVY
jgi:outer membrane protein OmpA-like peptidoglycan-associated protein